MRRAIAFLLALCLFFGQVPAGAFAVETGSTPILTADVEEADTFTIFVKAPESWGIPNLWAWNPELDQDLYEKWPGKAMTLDNGWYCAEVPAWVSYVVFSNQKGSVQTADISISSADVWFSIAENASYRCSYENPDDMPDDSGLSDLQLYGSASFLMNDTLELTPLKTNHSGSAWFNHQIYTEKGFSVEVNYWAGGGRGNSFGGADGIAVSFSPVKGLGGNGEYLGFVGNGAVAVELDSYSENTGDPDGKHVAIIEDRASHHLAYTLDDRVDDSQWHLLRITYEEQTLSVYIDGDLVLSYSGIELPNTVYLGVSAATGSGYNQHLINRIYVDGPISLGGSFDADAMALIRQKSATRELLITPAFCGDTSANNIIGKIGGVSVSSACGEETIPAGGYSIRISDAVRENMILFKNGYRDYVLPTAVASTLVDDTHAVYMLTAYMQKDHKDGKPYISTVFGRESGSGKPYTDLRVTALPVKEDTASDIIVSAVGFGDQTVTYYIAQDSARKTSSTSGVFSGKKLFDLFDGTGTVYVYAVGSDGSRTEPMEIRIDRQKKDTALENLFTESEFSLLGNDFLKIKISDSIPVLGGTELSLDAISVPIGVDVQGSEVKISIGLDVFERKSEGGSVETQDIFHDFKDMIYSTSKKVQSGKDTIDDYKRTVQAVDAFCKKNKIKRIGWVAEGSKSNSFDVNILGYLECKIVDGKLVVRESAVSVGGKFLFQYTAQGAVWIIPVYGGFEAGGSVTASGKVSRALPDQDVPFEFGIVLDLVPEVTGRAGAGIKGAVSGGLYATGKMPIKAEFMKRHFTLGLSGEIGVEGELFILQGRKPLLDGDTSLIDYYWGKSKTAVCAVTMREEGTVDAPAAITIVAPRDYAANTSGWLGGREPAFSLNAVGSSMVAARGVSFRELQKSIFSNSQPQLVVVGDQMLLAWVEDDTSRDTYNRMRLVYSVYEPISDTWSEPMPVWDDGCNDGYPRLVSDGENAYILWQKVNTTLNAENTASIDATLENAELCLARFDAASGTFEDTQMLTDNSLYEYAHNAVLVDGEPVVYWAAAEDNAMDTSGTNTLYRWENGTTEIIAGKMNYVLSVDAANGEVTYVMDADGDLSGAADVTAFTVSDTGTVVFDNSETGSAVTYAGYASLSGESILFLSDMQNIYYEQDGEVKTVLAESRAMEGNLNIVETDLGTAILWTETVEGWNELYAVTYEDGTWSEPVKISENGELLTKISAVSYDGKLTGVCNTNAVTYEEASGEYVRGETDLALFRVNDFFDIALGDYLTINEDELEVGAETGLNVTVYNNGTVFVDEVTFTVADTLGTESVQTVAVEIPSGCSEIVALTYPVPEGYTSTTLTVTAEIGDTDADESDNSVSLQIGNHDLAVTETAVEMLNGGYLLRSIVENGSLVDAENVTLSVYAGEEASDALQTVTIGTIARENYALAEILLKEDALSFDENGAAKVYLKLNADGTESADADNMLCSIVTRFAETVCMHPVTEMVAAQTPTCTEAGHEAYEICAACGETVGDIVEIPAWSHSYENGVCAGCGAKDPDYGREVATGWSGSTTWVLTSDGVLTFSGEGNMKNYGYAGGQPWTDYADQIRSVVLEEGVSAVGSGAFMNLTKLESVTLPESGLTRIGEAAFYGCASLKAIDIPDTVYTVFDYTFKNCTALADVRLSKVLIKIGQGAFENCTALDYIYVPGNTEIIGSWSFKGCTGLMEAEMTWADATEIREGAFKNCSALTTVYLPGNIQVLGESCFYGIGATSFMVPETVKEVQAWCFARAYSLKEIVFQGNAPTIGEGAFNMIALTACYPAENATWTADIMLNYGGTVSWKAN